MTHIAVAEIYAFPQDASPVPVTATLLNTKTAETVQRVWELVHDPETPKRVLIYQRKKAGLAGVTQELVGALTTALMHARSNTATSVLGGIMTFQLDSPATTERPQADNVRAVIHNALKELGHIPLMGVTMTQFAVSVFQTNHLVANAGADTTAPAE